MDKTREFLPHGTTQGGDHSEKKKEENTEVQKESKIVPSHTRGRHDNKSPTNDVQCGWIMSALQLLHWTRSSQLGCSLEEPWGKGK